MPTREEDKLTVQKQEADLKAQQLGEQSMEYGTVATSLQGMVMDAVRADRTQRGVSQLATDVGTTLGQIPTDTAGIRQRAGDMVNPMDVDVLTASQRGQNLQTLGTIAEQQQYNQGTITDVLGEHAASLQAIAQQKAYEAQEAATEAQSLMQQLDYQRQQQVDAWNRYMDEQQLAIAQAKLALASSSNAIPSQLLSMFGQGEKPQYTPATGEGTVENGWTFENGQWQAKGVENILSDPSKIAAMIMADPKNASLYTGVYKLFEKDEEEDDAEKARKVISSKAQVVLDVINSKSTYGNNEEAYQDALRYAVSDYNKRAFEEGGKALTPSEQAVIAGTQIRTTPGRQANIYEEMRGITPASASSVIINDDEANIINKMNIAINGASGASGRYEIVK